MTTATAATTPVNADNVDYTVNTYTAQFDESSNPDALEPGETYRTPEERSPDGREENGFSRLLNAADCYGDYLHTTDGWDYYIVAPNPEF